MSALYPVRLDKLQSSMFEVLKDIVDTDNGGPSVLWAYGESPWDAMVSDAGLVSLQLVGGPTPINRSIAHGTAVQSLESAEMRITSADPDVRTGLVIMGETYFTDSIIGDTALDIANRIVAKITEDDYAEVSAIAIAPDMISIIPIGIGIYAMGSFGNIEADSFVEGPSMLVTEVNRAVAISIECFGKGRELRDGAVAMMAGVMGGLQAPLYVSQLTNAGVGILELGQPVDISALAGGHWETRQSMTMRASMMSRVALPTDTIEKLHFTFTGYDVAGNQITQSGFTSP